MSSWEGLEPPLPHAAPGWLRVHEAPVLLVGSGEEGEGSAAARRAQSATLWRYPASKALAYGELMAGRVEAEPRIESVALA